MNDLYWTAVLQQEGIVDDYQHREYSFEKISTSASNIIDDATAESLQGQSILEPSKRLQALNKLVKQLAAFGAKAESKKTLAEQIETAAYKKSSDLDDYFSNITAFVNNTLFSSGAVTNSLPANKSFSSPLRCAPLDEKRERADVLATLRGYQLSFQNLIGEVGGRLLELESSSSSCWTCEEKQLPTVYSQMTAVYQLLQTSLKTPSETAIGGVTTEMLRSIEKQIDYWLSLGSRFPIPYSSKANKSASLEALKKVVPRSHTSCRSPPAKLCAELPPKKATASQLPSLFYTPLHSISNLPRFAEPRTSTFNGLQLPPFNPPKTLPLKGSQPLLPSSAESALGASPLFSSSPKRVSSSRRPAMEKVKDEDDALEAISNLSSLHKPGNESHPGSKETSPRTSLSGKSTRGRKVNRTFDTDFEHAFILSKLAQLNREQEMEFKSVGNKRGTKRALGKQEEGAKVVGKNRATKRARTGEFEMQLRAPVSGDSRFLGFQG